MGMTTRTARNSHRHSLRPLRHPPHRQHALRPFPKRCPNDNSRLFVAPSRRIARGLSTSPPSFRHRPNRRASCRMRTVKRPLPQPKRIASRKHNDVAHRRSHAFNLTPDLSGITGTFPVTALAGSVLAANLRSFRGANRSSGIVRSCARGRT